MKALLSITGALEAATGLALSVAPSALVTLLLAAPLNTPTGMTVGRVAGVAMIALGVASWLARDDGAVRTAKGLVAAMLFYNVAVVTILVLAGGKPGPVRHRLLAGGSGSVRAGRLVLRVPERETVLAEISPSS